MVKCDSTPPAFIMTIVATGIREIFRADKSLMNVLMAIDATLSNLPEMPGCICLIKRFPVTGKTRGGKMGSLQTESTLIVLVNGESEFVKSIHRMTLGTIGRHPLFRKLVFMIICVAIAAAGEL